MGVVFVVDLAEGGFEGALFPAGDDVGLRVVDVVVGLEEVPEDGLARLQRLEGAEAQRPRVGAALGGRLGVEGDEVDDADEGGELRDEGGDLVRHDEDADAVHEGEHRADGHLQGGDLHRPHRRGCCQVVLLAAWVLVLCGGGPVVGVEGHEGDDLFLAVADGDAPLPVGALLGGGELEAVHGVEGIVGAPAVVRPQVREPRREMDRIEGVRLLEAQGVLVSRVVHAVARVPLEGPAGAPGEVHPLRELHAREPGAPVARRRRAARRELVQVLPPGHKQHDV
mmetsp:Transcript_1386/g.4739  ORF Transcript_1386/g.4739 Transcript_1386/m.4739 type:complete len:282 (-) Transcript_1386:301-1146(-)